MGVLVKYKFEDLSEVDVIKIGKALGGLTIEEGVDLHQRLQAQIFAQERAEKEMRQMAEREKLLAELSKPKSTSRRKDK